MVVHTICCKGRVGGKVEGNVLPKLNQTLYFSEGLLSSHLCLGFAFTAVLVRSSAGLVQISHQKISRSVQGNDSNNF